MADVPVGERKLAPNEHLFLGQPHTGKHRWAVMDGKVTCGLCGKLRRGETMPARRPPLLP